jgi:hypothetical protein
MIRFVVILGLVTLAGCGADGPPITPSLNSSVSVGTDGLNSSTGVSVSTGPVTVGARF